YVSRGLMEGFDYTYEVVVETTRGDRIVRETKTVQMRAGNTTDLAFSNATADLETVLVVRVPRDAKVYLGGNETNATGTERVFRTTSLAEGQEWSNYRIKAVYERDGQLVTREEVIVLKSGDQRTVSLDSELGPETPEAPAQQEKVAKLR
ncbi:MAG: TIGR03000 domain-containing protein, partial [Planctomycetota bacterium]